MERWSAVLAEVRRQAQYVAELVEAKTGMDRSNSAQDVDEGWTVVGGGASISSGKWQQQQWHAAFELLFFDAPSQGTEHNQDDLLFFVYTASYREAMRKPLPLFVRRNGSRMPADLAVGQPAGEHVDWLRSVMLNLIMHAAYTLSVAVCPRDKLRGVSLQGPPAPDVLKVAKPVFASTTQVSVNLDNSRSEDEAPSSCYPDICFAVDNFEDAFKSMVVAEPGHCYVVLLVAHSGLALSIPKAEASPDHLPRRLSRASTGADGSESDGEEGGPPRLRRQFSDPLRREEPGGQGLPSGANPGGPPSQSETGTADAAGASSVRRPGLHPDPPPADPGSRPSRAESVTRSNAGPAAPAARGPPEPATAAGQEEGLLLFSGYVSYEQLFDCMGAMRPPPRSASSSSAWAKLIGLGGSSENLSDGSPHRVRMKGPGGKGYAEVAVTAASASQDAEVGSMLRKQISGGLFSSSKDAPATRLPARTAYRCALMSLSLPVDFLASQVLML